MILGFPPGAARLAGVVDAHGHQLAGELGGDGVESGLDLDGAVAAGDADDLLTGQPVQSSSQRLTGIVANPIVRRASSCPADGGRPGGPAGSIPAVGAAVGAAECFP